MRGGPRDRVKIDDPGKHITSISVLDTHTGQVWTYRITADRLEAVCAAAPCVPKNESKIYDWRGVSEPVSVCGEGDEPLDDLLGSGGEPIDYCMGTEGPDFWDGEE
jgi:hypothetical protein